MQTPVRNARRWLWAATAGALVLAGACQRSPPIPADVAANIGGERLLYRQFEASLRDLQDHAQSPFEADVLNRLFDQFVDARLLIRLARDRGMEVEEHGGRPGREPPAAVAAGDGNDVDAPVAPGEEGLQDLSGAAERRAIDFLLSLAEEGPATDAEVVAFYETHRDEFVRTGEVHLRQILVHGREQAEAAKQALDHGEDFAEVAARFSQGPRAEQGGDQGRLAADDLTPDFRNVIFSLAAGEVSDIVEAYYGFLIFQVVEHFGADQVPLAEVEDEIRRTLRRQQVDELVKSFILEARSRYNVRVFPENLPFQYQGAYAKPTR